MQADATPARGAPTHAQERLSPGVWAWAAYEGARLPYIILITIYVFMPYFATTMVGDPVRGQALIAAQGKYSGWVVALTAPILGAAIDRYGPRKPWLFVTSYLMIPLIWSLWWARPDLTGLSVLGALFIVGVLGVLFPYTEMLHNSMLTRVAGERAAAASGLGLALGSATSLILLLAVLWALALPGQVDWPFIPAEPLFGLSAERNEPDRIAGPIVAAVFALGAIPLFFLSPDLPRTGSTLATALAGGLTDLWRLLKSLRGQRDVTIYLLARMIYADGKTALILFGGVYAAGVMEWGVMEMLAYGVLLSTFAILGALLGGALDERIGAKRAIQIEIAGSLLALLGLLGMSRDRILYLWDYDRAQTPPLFDGPMFTTLPELTYLFIGCNIAVWVTAAYASSRTMLARLVPAEQSGAFFGLYALSGTATVWLGPMLVEWSTRRFGSQQAGFAPIALLLVLGFAVLALVRDPERRRS